ncbi:MAG: hypothetical protein CMG13_02915 [Candidatus Marinimicrobia bacterium]|nr:hypothetical protein [Candidatus Neomarinimicrobiota bacterium]|tara:strand:+ start:3734 stop:4384 length:651 start_codon:yes stop_codon:yes gene_type:complete
MKIKLLIIITVITLSQLVATDFTITRLKYGGGGDWYSDPSSLPNLLDFLQNETNIKTASKEIKASIGSSDFYNNSYYYITGHGKINFSNNEINILRDVLLNGAFLHADDNYGMDQTFREEMKKVFPEKDWVELPHDHKIFQIFYKFPSGLPKIHNHDGKSPKALALFHNEKIIALYTYETDLGDGWEGPAVHNMPIDLHTKALKMGTNIIIYYLTN